MRYNINMKAKKSLGQNFLKSEPALKKIIEAGEIKRDDVVLEIGPGKGALTKQLLATGCRLIAVEKDYNLHGLLKIKFEKEILSGQLVLVQGDILELDSSVLSNFLPLRPSLGASGSKRDPLEQKIEKGYACEPENILRNYKIIANIPYNITGAILKKFLTAEKQPERMVLMVQHEVAKRIVAADKKESILSVSVKAYGEPKMLMKVPARYFSPAPKVDSAVIVINGISRDLFKREGVNEENFWKIVKAGFAHKRKMLSGNLKGVISFEKNGLSAFRDKRAEDLSLSDWILLARTLTF